MTAITPGLTLPDRRVLTAFVGFVLAAGGASVAIRITYGELAPFYSAAARFGIGAVAFWALVLRRRLPMPRGRALAGAVLFGAITVGLAFVLMAWGLIETPASLYQILMALVPLLTLFLARAQGVEGLTLRGVLGSLLAVAGIAVTVGGGSATEISAPHIIAILLGAALLAEGGVLIKKFPPNPPVVTNAVAMTVGAIILGVASVLRGEAWTIPTETDTWIAFVYLVVVVTIFAFLTYMFVLGKWTASGTSYGFVLIPLVTFVVAATVAGETLTAGLLLGSVLVLAGVVVGALLPRSSKPDEFAECSDRSGQVVPRCA